jgi:hypothetical protein
MRPPKLSDEQIPPVPTMLRQKFFTRLSYGGHGRNGNVSYADIGISAGPSPVSGRTWA